MGNRKKSDPKFIIDGIFAVEKGQLKGWFPSDKLQGLRWMYEDAKLSQVTTQSATVNFAYPKHRYKVVQSESQSQMDVEASVTGNVLEFLAKNRLKNKVEGEMNKQIEEEIRSTFAETLKKGVDIYNLKNRLYRKQDKN
ncbi:hypothetical protein HQN89_31230 [Paenibacillus frigoriresistens]|uniref:Ger(x)C family spore germination C-terminal domain-containing protein n=1 Tax=Paenibacillus alginolyticus TaxID=59839 RepID=UPI001564C71E|nr:Ger(x)C family spore germination C-terminal domain-containing protein [Paenibacillus frigoriresistens]NRF95351.1 hypothetical protein [Paenibacillus frigoriresistens]